MHPNLVSVIIPSFNGERYLRETIESVLIQTWSILEIIVVDDGSTDNTRNIVRELMTRDERIKYIYKHNGGVSSARNEGFKNALGEYIAFLDADDVWEKNNLQCKVELLQREQFSLVHSDAHLIDGQSKLIGGRLQGSEGMILDSILEWKHIQIPGPSSILIRRQVIEQSGLFDVNCSTSADFDFFLRVAKLGKVGRVPQTTWRYRIHSNNMHKNITALEHDMIYVFEKAHDLKLFKSRAFETHCRSNMFLTLAMCWFGDGKRYLSGLKYLVKAILTDFAIVITIFRKIRKRV
jgi:glycosyltransferase involved in cell wall biosynthesis